MATPGGAGAWTRLAWFVGLYGAGVLAVGAVAYLLRAAMFASS
jgi:hypothetical protein